MRRFLGGLLIASCLVSSAMADWTFIRGDANGDWSVDVADAIDALTFLFSGGTSQCLDAVDANDDGETDVADVVYLLSFLFSGGTAPSSPFPGCGTDPTVDGLDCAGPVDGCDELAPAGMVPVPAGDFEMGRHVGSGNPDELPIHDVSLDAFSMDVYEVTNDQYAEFLNLAYAQGTIEVTGGVVTQAGTSVGYCDTTTSSIWSRIGWDGGEFTVSPATDLLGNPMGVHPMVRVSWYGAAAYANWRSEQEGRPLCYDFGTWECTFVAESYRLPTEAEWEYAARGGESTPYFRYPWGDSIDGSMANYGSSSDPYDVAPTPRTTPVGYYDGAQTPLGVDMANGYGLYDISGNVWEWCNDWYSSSYYSVSPVDNPQGPSSSSGRVQRGGSWGNFGGGFLRCANRYGFAPDARYGDVGFRLALPLTPGP